MSKNPSQKMTSNISNFDLESVGIVLDFKVVMQNRLDKNKEKENPLSISKDNFNSRVKSSRNEILREFLKRN